jgi:hypothetical protein
MAKRKKQRERQNPNARRLKRMKETGVDEERGAHKRNPARVAEAMGGNVLKSGTLSWKPGDIPSVTGGRSPAADFSAALMRGDPVAERLANQALKEPKEEASLADMFVAETYTLPKRLGLNRHQTKAIEPILQSYRQDMRNAHRFVLDNDFVRYATEISSTTPPEKLLARLQFATLPYDITWIEFDLRTKVEVMRELHNMDNSKFNWDDVADRLGLIIRRLSDTEAVVEMVCETHGNYGLIGTTICYFYSVREYEFSDQDGRGTGCRPLLPSGKFLADNNPTATDKELDIVRAIGPASLWGYSAGGRSTVIDKMAQMADLRLPEFLMRHGQLGTGRMEQIIMTLVSSTNTRTVEDTITSLLVSETTEFTGMMRWVVIILACINEVPIDTQHVQPRGNIRTSLTGRRPLMDYHRIVLRVPKEKPIQYIERQLRVGTRRRAHEVMSHWRTYVHADSACPRDEHDWTYDEEHGYALCGICMAYRRRIPEHIRGDPSLGWVRKDYVVKPSKQE